MGDDPQPKPSVTKPGSMTKVEVSGALKRTSQEQHRSMIIGKGLSELNWGPENELPATPERMQAAKDAYKAMFAKAHGLAKSSLDVPSSIAGPLAKNLSKSGEENDAKSFEIFKTLAGEYYKARHNEGHPVTKEQAICTVAKGFNEFRQNMVKAFDAQHAGLGNAFVALDDTYYKEHPGSFANNYHLRDRYYFKLVNDKLTNVEALRGHVMGMAPVEAKLASALYHGKDVPSVATLKQVVSGTGTQPGEVLWHSGIDFEEIRAVKITADYAPAKKKEPTPPAAKPTAPPVPPTPTPVAPEPEPVSAPIPAPKFLDYDLQKRNGAYIVQNGRLVDDVENPKDAHGQATPTKVKLTIEQHKTGILVKDPAAFLKKFGADGMSVTVRDGRGNFLHHDVHRMLEATQPKAEMGKDTVKGLLKDFAHPHGVGPTQPAQLPGAPAAVPGHGAAKDTRSPN